MKKRLFFIIFLICITLIGCNVNHQENIEKIEVKEYLLPNSFIEFSGGEKAEQVKSFIEKGEDYCTDVTEDPEGIILHLTPSQKEIIIKDNKEFVDSLITDFSSSNSEYKCLIDDTRNTLSLYYDENIDPGLQIKTILGIASMMAFNDILENRTTEWSVKIEIINCHTNKEVVSVTIPQEEVSFGAKEWEESR